MLPTCPKAKVLGPEERAGEGRTYKSAVLSAPVKWPMSSLVLGKPVLGAVPAWSLTPSPLPPVSISKHALLPVPHPVSEAQENRGDRFLPSTVTPLSPAQEVAPLPDALGMNAFFSTSGKPQGLGGSLDRTEGKAVRLL